jgi:NADH:ubiquinone oxidoreductase subunit H
MSSFLLNIGTVLALAILKIICLLIAIAYFTLAERKIMAAVQRRVGPNVVGPFGLLQPLADGLKLAGKELTIPAQASSRIFMTVAITVLLFALSGWSAIPFGLFDHSEFMNNSTIAKILVLTEPQVFAQDDSVDPSADNDDEDDENGWDDNDDEDDDDDFDVDSDEDLYRKILTAEEFA